jgi:DNA repair protein RecN (Recombination protein N)
LLTDLRVQNFALIENLSVEFGSGLNVISGETGSGKSVLLRSLGLLMGEKASLSWVKNPQLPCTVEGVFNLTARKDVSQALDDLGIDCSEGTLIIRRVINQDKSKIYMNGTIVTLQNLKEIVCPLLDLSSAHVPLIEMTGQHDNKNLLSRSFHLDLLDIFSQNLEAREDFEKLYREFIKLQHELKEAESTAHNNEQRKDYLSFQLQEINEIDPKPSEDQEIEARLKGLKSAERLFEANQFLQFHLLESDEAFVSSLKQFEKLLKGVSLEDLKYPLFEKLNALKEEATEIAYQFERYSEGYQKDFHLLPELEERLHLLRKLQKKFGPELSHVLAAKEQIEKELLTLDSQRDLIQSLQARLLALKSELAARAAKLHESRVAAQARFSRKVNSELKDLNMKGVQFSVQIERLPELNSFGQTAVEFLIQTSAGRDFQPIAKIASGGELSRILLSIKKIVGQTRFPRTYLFDEVDAGVSGLTAQKVGEKLKAIAKNQQVIIVTHLPQVASFGDHHFVIEKVVSTSANKGSSAKTVLRPVKGADRLREIARLLSGEKITTSSLKNAEELLSSAQ